MSFSFYLFLCPLSLANYIIYFTIDLDLLQLKEPSKLILVRKSTLQHGKPQVIPHYLWSRIAQKNTYDPMLKRVDELNKDLELVYVGQICLSWEMLCWQHDKIKELKQYDLPWLRSYNQVAAEFLHFQALIQRFLEEEPIQQGHRIQNYVKNRSLVRNLLQVPPLIGAPKINHLFFIIFLRGLLLLLFQAHTHFQP